MRRLVLIAGVLALLPAADAGAISRARAGAVALSRLSIDTRRESVVVFGLPRPLERGSVVHEALPRSGSSRRARVPAHRLRRRAWLYWADRAPRAAFTHASRLLLVDDRSGRVVLDEPLLWWPLIDKRRPPFLRTAAGYESGRYRVFTAGASAAVAPPATAAPEPAARRAQTLSNDCAIVAGDIGDPKFAGSINAVRQTLRAQGALRVAYAGTTTSLGESVEDLQRAGCGHIAIFLIGHAPPAYVGTFPLVGPVGAREPTIQLGLEAVRLGPGRATIVSNRITAAQLAGILRDAAERRPGANSFSVIVEGCWSGRFVPPLMGLPNVSLVASSVSSGQLALQYLPPGSNPVVATGLAPGFPWRRVLTGASRVNRVPNPHRASGFINALMQDLPGALADGRGLAAALGKAIFHPRTENTTFTFGTGHTQLAVSGKLVLSGETTTRVDLAGDGAGTVTGERRTVTIPLRGGDIPPGNSLDVRTGVELTFTAEPAAGYKWGGWGGSCDTGQPDESATCTFVARRRTEVVYATFDKLPGTSPPSRPPRR